MASVNGTAGLQIRMSGYVEQQASTDPNIPIETDGATLAGDPSGITTPNVTVNGDRAGAPQNETSIAVDPNNPARIVGSANDYVTRTWSCYVGTTPCSALGDGYSGTYASNDGGTTWCCTGTDTTHLGTLIPGVEHLTGGPYDGGGDPSVAFDSRGNVYYAGLGFDRTSAPNTVAVNKGTFNIKGALTWGQPTFIDQTTSPAIFNNKEWIGVDSNVSSPFRDRVYVSFTRFVFNPIHGNYVQSPIFEAYSSNGGQTFSTPQSIVGNVLYDQGSRPVVGPDGTVYVFFEGSTRRAQLSSTYMVKSTNGGVTWSSPTSVSTLSDIVSPADTHFRVNSFPAAAVAPNGTLYASWSTEVANGATGFVGDPACTYFLSRDISKCHAAAVYSTSTDGGSTWTAPTPVLPTVNGSFRTSEGYPQTQPNGSTLPSPSNVAVDTFWPAVAISSSGRVYMSAYAADVESPWQTCTKYSKYGSVQCLTPGKYINNGGLDYVVTDLTTNVTQTVTTEESNTQYEFCGGFIGDYTGLAVGSDNMAHPMWTDTRNQQTISWFYGHDFGSLPANQQDVATSAVSF